MAAHQAMRADASIQFDFTRPPKPPEPPAWLRKLAEWIGDALAPVGRFLRWISSLMPDAPYARILLWTLIVLLAAGLVWMIVDRARGGEWRLPRRPRRRRKVEATAAEEIWAPEAGPARAWLEEADALAAEGHYAEAVHHLLFRSVEDIARRRPQLVRPALTSRELARAEALPPAVRGLFASIAALVERSLFGGRPVGGDDWRVARAAYADLALNQAWRG
ncbi:MULTISPECIES: DUF4129 domain-containing protein [Sphingomonas]|uniref:DUF4129 domain-containing protein n=1 Tax=Sphingomonas TaxID=13687 RepID=UPI0022390BAD|nr:MULTISPECIES: DUF4129 domain-containing protein [unclassified Sphingomonas]